jgi:Bacterial antitoxin of type II TA system, VapB
MPKKTALLIDEEKVAEVRRILGTASTTETIDAALGEVINRHRRQALVDYFSSRSPEDNLLILKSWG